jgi:hypothetical protein
MSDTEDVGGKPPGGADDAPWVVAISPEPPANNIVELVSLAIANHPLRERIGELFAAGAKVQLRVMEADPDAPSLDDLDPHQLVSEINPEDVPPEPIWQAYVDEGDEYIGIVRIPITMIERREAS